MLTREMFCHKFYLLDGAGAGDGGGDIYGLSMENIGISPGDEPGLPGEAPGEVSTEHSYSLIDSWLPGPYSSESTRELGGVGGIRESGGEKKTPLEPVMPGIITPGVTPEVVKATPKAKKRQRRPTILSEMEGLMYTAPGKRRSLLGG